MRLPLVSSIRLLYYINQDKICRFIIKNCLSRCNYFLVVLLCRKEFSVALFRRKNKNIQKNDTIIVEVAKPQRSVLFRKEFAQAGSFRGFRRLQLRHIDVDGCEDTLSAFRPAGFNFKGCTIIVEGIEETSNGSTYRMVDVYVDGSRIGQVKSTMANELSMLFDYEYDKVHLKVDESYHADGTVMGTNIYLFVHYPGEEPIKVSYK